MHWVGGWLELKSGLDVVTKGTVYCLYWQLDRRFIGRPVPHHLQDTATVYSINLYYKHSAVIIYKLPINQTVFKSFLEFCIHYDMFRLMWPSYIQNTWDGTSNIKFYKKK
jgi:hypothetical protein